MPHGCCSKFLQRHQFFVLSAVFIFVHFIMLNPCYKEQCKLTSHAEERLSFKILTHIWLDHKCMMAHVPKFRFSSLIIFHNLFLHMYRCRWSVYTWKHFFSKVIINMLRWLKGKKMVGIPFVIEKIFLFKVALFFWGILRVF